MRDEREERAVGYTVDIDALPDRYPTHKHDPLFWENLGRAVATFGFLEEILSKAIFALTATRPYTKDAYQAWLTTLDRALSDPLGPLIDAYGRAARNHPDVTLKNLTEFLDALREAARMRNVLCHGSWDPPDPDGASLPFFVDRSKRVMETRMDCQFLDQVQRHTSELACVVIGTVSRTGWQFPGSDLPGKRIWEEQP